MLTFLLVFIIILLMIFALAIPIFFKKDDKGEGCSPADDISCGGGCNSCSSRNHL